ncbi:MAG TPA: class I SAM-dependent methyltransferase [Saprospiraceae bacterium]|nr:class I SAM-dependent methyltransferase [Saprospiraceae bacterium]HMQ85271.1 class I SAM-dependent methyltransferase [Saprospiraceae bacterium]
MEDYQPYFEANRQAWNQRTEVHLKSDFYDLEGFAQGKNSLNEIELQLLGDVRGKSILHLQCHFGQDTLSLARMGAHTVGVDISDEAINAARQLNEQLGLNSEFICCNIYDLPQHLDRQFDLVFTTYGVIGWLPDLEAWAGLIHRYLKPGGQLVFVEFHPVVWMFDNDFQQIAYSYFNAEVIIETGTGTYADREAAITYQEMSWNHAIAEVVQALLNHQLEIRRFQEYDYSPYNCFSHTVEVETGKFRIGHLGAKIPMVYAVLAQKVP